MSANRAHGWLFGSAYLLMPLTAFVMGVCVYGEAPFGTLSYANEKVSRNEATSEIGADAMLSLDAQPGVWQLSVINGGQPRGTRTMQPVAAETVTRSELAFAGGESHEPSNMLIRRDDNTSGEPHDLRFGPAGSTRLTADFNGDGKAEVAAFLDGQWFIDLNGNQVWDNGDLWIELGSRGDRPVVGDWDGDGKADIGVFGRKTASRRLPRGPGLPDVANHSQGRPKNLPAADSAGSNLRVLQRTAAGELRGDLVEHVFLFGTTDGLPVAGDFNGDGIATIGLFSQGHWLLDSNGDGRLGNEDAAFEFGLPGDRPVVGDFNGDGIDEIGVFRDGLWIIDMDGDHAISDGDLIFEFGQPGDRPVSGDFHGEGEALPAVIRSADINL